MRYLLLDANNLLFRARYAAARRNYDNAIIHVFFRSLKPIIEKFSPDVAFFVLDVGKSSQPRLQHLNVLLEFARVNRAPV